MIRNVYLEIISFFLFFKSISWVFFVKHDFRAELVYIYIYIYVPMVWQVTHMLMQR